MTLSTRVSRRPDGLVSDKLLRTRALLLTLDHMTEAVFCHDCRSVVDVDPGAFTRVPAIAPPGLKGASSSTNAGHFSLGETTLTF